MRSMAMVCGNGLHRARRHPPTCISVVVHLVDVKRANVGAHAVPYTGSAQSGSPGAQMSRYTLAMHNVVFVAPFAFDTTLRFVSAAAEHAGGRLALVSQDPLEKFPAELRNQLAAHQRIGNALDPGAIVAGIEEISARIGPVDRLLGTLEQLQVPLAEVRERLGIEGMAVPGSPRTFVTRRG